MRALDKADISSKIYKIYSVSYLIFIFDNHESRTD